MFDASGVITPVEVEYATAEAFIRHPGTQPPTTDPEHAYSRAVLNTEGLLAYWRLAESRPGEARDEVEQRGLAPFAQSAEQKVPVPFAAPSQSSEQKIPVPFADHASAAGRSPGHYAEFWMADFRQPGALFGPANHAIHFNGESYIEVADHPSLNGDWDGLTLAAWIKPDSKQPASASPSSLIVGKWAYEVTGDAYALFYEHSGKLKLAVGNGMGGEQGLVGTGNVPIDSETYHFVVGTWEKATGDYRLYVDGQPDSAQGQQKAPHKVNARGYVPVLIGGQRATNSRYFAGCIDEVSIFNRTLSAEEVVQLYRMATGESENEEGKAEPGRVRSE